MHRYIVVNVILIVGRSGLKVNGTGIVKGTSVCVPFY